MKRCRYCLVEIDQKDHPPLWMHTYNHDCMDFTEPEPYLWLVDDLEDA